MSDQQNQRFKYLNSREPVQSQLIRPMNENVKINRFQVNQNLQDVSVGLGWHQKDKVQNSQSKTEQIAEQERLRDRKIRKLTIVNKNILQQLKQQNDQLTKRVNKQKFRIPKKSCIKTDLKGHQNTKQLQAISRQLQNAYRQIQFYRQTISILKAKEASLDEQQKMNDQLSKLKQSDEKIQKMQQQLKTQRGIKNQQDKQLSKIANQQTSAMIQRLDLEILQAKCKLKQVKKNYIRRQQLQKKQHAYLVELQMLVRRTKAQELKQSAQQYYPPVNKAENRNAGNIWQQVSELQWKNIKEKIASQKKKYQQFGKKLTFQNHRKSKTNKNASQIELKYRQKVKIMQKLKNKLNEVDNLARLRSKPQILQKVDLKLEKLKDIISRQTTIQMISSNKNKNRAQSEDVKQFKKWQIYHTATLNQHSISQHQNLHNIKNQSD